MTAIATHAARMNGTKTTQQKKGGTFKSVFTPKVAKAFATATAKSSPKVAAKVAKIVKPRKGFFLDADDVEQLKTEWKETKQIPCPHNRGCYRGIVVGLLNLGKDKPHTFAALKAEIVTILSDVDTKDDDGKTAWQRFSKKESHAEEPEDGLKLNQKIEQNIEVLQRLGGETPYGLRLLQVGTMVLKSKGVVIDIIKAKDGSRMYRLNSNSAKPQNDFKRSRSN